MNETKEVMFRVSPTTTKGVIRTIANQNIEFDKLSRIRAQLKKINKSGVKTIKIPDGDIIDCVLFHDQPAFDLPELKDQKTTLELPEWPIGYNISEDTTIGVESFQLWSHSDEECTEGTIPILRTTEQDLLRVILSRSIANKTIELNKLSRINAHLEKINKLGVKTMKSPDGDIIDCVLFHDQPTFDLPELNDQKTTLELPKWPMGYNINEDTTIVDESFQIWTDSGEECPELTIPILRTTEEDLLRNIEFDKLSRIRAQLKKINKPGVKTIKSPDGDIIDCVLFHDQPAFDLPELKDQKTTLELPEWPIGYNISKDTTIGVESFQLWSHSGEECPEGTIPILRTTEQDLLRVRTKDPYDEK
ncbi:unnamed protein product [Lupinus luteus]|uniref:Neprosin activation peptide domain-containing protein n=1 Tax=Lupinus luteus TaxID=3873 RepID=A0AAV1VXX0_LUPLU